MGLLISFPLLSLLLGTITAIFINRELPYTKRYLKAFILTLTFIYILFAIGGIWQVIFGYV